jgi:hypothetical protein
MPLVTSFLTRASETGISRWRDDGNDSNPGEMLRSAKPAKQSLTLPQPNLPALRVL